MLAGGYEGWCSDNKMYLLVIIKSMPPLICAGHPHVGVSGFSLPSFLLCGVNQYSLAYIKHTLICQVIKHALSLLLLDL